MKVVNITEVTPHQLHYQIAQLIVHERAHSAEATAICFLMITILIKENLVALCAITLSLSNMRL
eukprot:COSAG01_NODE_19277_length_1019_cov_21.110870_2_plen_64_part_00